MQICPHFVYYMLFSHFVIVGRFVPVLIPPDLKPALDALVENRSKLDIWSSNPYLFALPRFSSHLQSWDTLRKHSRQFGLKNPDFMRSTNLRRYLCTNAQLLDMGQQGIEFLSAHMGKICFSALILWNFKIYFEL